LVPIPDLVLVVALLAYGMTLWLYRRALERHGLRSPIGAGGLADEGSYWVRDLFTRQPLRRLELYRLVSLLLMVVIIATIGWAIAS
jgi:hypothetical protein